MNRWEALVRYDDEIREAAATLIPFGSHWVAKLGEAFFALGENRKYLPNIVARLTEEATLEAQEAERAEALQWLWTVRTTKEDGEISKEALAVLIELCARGFQIGKEDDGSIRITRSDRGSSFAYSNPDIMRLGKILLKQPR